MPLLILRGGPYDAAGVILGNGFIFAGWSLQVVAVRRLAGRPVWPWLAPLASLVWVGACFVPAPMADPAARMMLASGLSALLSGIVALGLAQGWTGWKPLRLPILLLCGAQPALHLVRIAVAGLAGPAAAAAMNPAIIISGVTAIVVCSLILITEATRRAGQRSQAEIAAAFAATAASRDLLARLIGHLPSVVYTARIEPNLDCRREYLSANTERVLGWPRAALEADDALEARTLRENPDLRDALEELLAEGESWRERKMVRADGSHIWVKRHARIARRFPDGSAELVGTITDITRERTLAAQVQASAKLATLGEMMTGLAHELGQPAATMCLAAGNAARGLRNRGEAAIPDALNRLDRIIAQGERMSTLMRHLKAFARSEPLLLGPVAVARAVEGALVLTEAGLRHEEIVLELDLADDLPLVQAQLVPLEQVLVNLLLNARDAIRGLPPEAPRRIALRAAPAGAGQVVIAVADTGGGLPPAALERLFEPFFTTKPLGEGLGLGLSVSHGLVKGMGGDIVAANDAAGAVFTVTLPCAPALLPA
ncbi:MAG: sensor histidine kinase [Paracraurococcus sp.]